MTSDSRISPEKLEELREAVLPLVGVQFTSLLLPALALPDIEPSQVGTIVGTLMDALIPHLDGVADVGLTKHEGTLGDREGYPDYRHDTLGLRVELKLIFVDNPNIRMKKPPTPREPSARLTQKVTVKNVNPAIDAMLCIAYQLQAAADRSDSVTPTVIDLGVFSMIELVQARDKRLIDSGGRWFGDYETPCILSQIGRRKKQEGLPLDTTTYGRKAAEGKDYNEDTNFGKLKRIPHSQLDAFLHRHTGGS
ncbi:MAG: hypothetical protein OXK77_00010 [Gemmatimonadota bacterium]|nr:hypothetical protein [Gemmatimonadota bacterium]MDE2865292.1 hypothetical protein [Gemmatimonadota bacterium]